MRKTFIFGIALLLSLIYVSCAFAFESGDWQLWNTESVEAKLSKRWKVKVEEELRFGDNLSEIYYMHTDGGLTLKVTDGLDLGINYRQIYEKKESSKWEDENRPHANAIFSWLWKNFKFTDGNRLEYRIRDGKSDAWRYRNKLTVKAPWKWTSLEAQPYLADEIFVDFYGEKLNRNRLYAGIESKLFEHLKADIFYLWQTSKKKPDKWTDYNILGIKIKAVF